MTIELKSNCCKSSYTVDGDDYQMWRVCLECKKTCELEKMPDIKDMLDVDAKNDPFGLYDLSCDDNKMTLRDRFALSFIKSALPRNYPKDWKFEDLWKTAYYFADKGIEAREVKSNE